MPYMTQEFSYHADDCPDAEDSWVLISDLPDEVSPTDDDLTCKCWN
jgi:hypothetical protein